MLWYWDTSIVEIIQLYDLYNFDSCINGKAWETHFEFLRLYVTIYKLYQHHTMYFLVSLIFIFLLIMSIYILYMNLNLIKKFLLNYYWWWLMLFGYVKTFIYNNYLGWKAYFYLKFLAKSPISFLIIIILTYLFSRFAILVAAALIQLIIFLVSFLRKIF